MTEAALTERLWTCLAESAGFSKCHAILRAFKESGGEQKAAYGVLAALPEDLTAAPGLSDQPG